jgi:hypothetical protein
MLREASSFDSSEEQEFLILSMTYFLPIELAVGGGIREFGA